MKDCLDDVKAAFDFDECVNIAYNLAHLERRSSYDDFERSTRYCMDVMRRMGYTNVERIAHKADGVSTTYDCTMPQAWSLDAKKRSFLEVIDGEMEDFERILADSQVDPLSASFWCSPTPRGGITAELINFDEIGMDNLEKARGKWLLYMPMSGFTLTGGTLKKFVDAGVAGLVMSNMLTLDTTPNDLQWFNGNGYCGWYLSKEDKRVPGFSIPARRARTLARQLKEQGRLVLHGELYTKIYDGEIYTVTGIIPGESKEEVALFAHLYEPFVGDDAIGFAHLVEFGQQLMKRQVKLKKTLRLVFSMELYGFAQYLKKHGRNIVLAANFDGGTFLESSDILLRRLPFFNAMFTDWTNDDILRKRLPNTRITMECGNHSDDTFANDPYFHGGIPTFWIHSPCEHSHHNNGYEFMPNWLTAKEQFPVFAEVLENILCVDRLPDFSKRAAAEFTASVKEIMSNPQLKTYDKGIYVNVEYTRQEKRLESVTRFTGQKVNMKPLQDARKSAQKELETLPLMEFTSAEYKALNLVVKHGPYGLPFSLTRIPMAERHPVGIPRIVWSLIDGKRNLLECIRMSNAEGDNYLSDQDILMLMEQLKYVAKYGYATIREKETLTTRTFANAVRELGVKKGMKMIVHCKFSSLGKVIDGPEALCKVLQDAVGPEGVLMMPTFTFQIYHPGRRTIPFDVKNTPGTTGILSETFRKMPDVYRSIDPCHSYCVWGKDARKYVERHHLIPTVDPLESPLGLLAHEDGYAMMISCNSSVTYMHMLEDEFGATCCGKRTEEYDTILPDGQQVKTRSWGWRKKTCDDCPARHTLELYDIMRQRGKIQEIMLNNAHIAFFPLSEYRYAYLKLMKKICRNTAVPRENECTVPTDWDAKKRRLKKNTSAYTGPWMP